jgi:pyruvyl transferase EpsO
VHICVPDRHLYDVALDSSDQVYLVPDMAHNLYPIRRDGRKRNGVLQITRVDEEKMQWRRLPPDVRTLTDWPLFVGRCERRINQFRRAIDALFRRRLRCAGNAALVRLWIWYSGRLIRDAVKLFARHRAIATDRLHGHILAALLNMPSTVIDNGYGKNSRYGTAWTATSDLVTLLADTGRPSASGNTGSARQGI